jgi:hypothetical protein
VFRLEWPPDIKQAVLQNAKWGGRLTNSDLEMAGLLFLWLVMEDVCNITPGTHIALLFSDNSTTVSWVRQLAAQGSRMAGQLIWALALRLKVRQASPLTPLHISGKDNALIDIPSRLFGSKTRWYCKTDDAFLTMFNQMFPSLRRTCGQTTEYLPTYVHE